MNNQLIRQSDIEQLLQPKKQDMIKLIGQDQLLRETSFAIQAVNGNPLLQDADKSSIAQAIWNVALTGLSLNPVTKLAYLTPRWNTKKQCQECVLMPSYQGLVKTVTDSLGVEKVDAYLVMEGDDFQLTYGTDANIIHRPKFPKGKVIIGAYAIARLKDGVQQFEVMDKDELDYIRSKSDGWKAFEAGKAKSAIWADWEPEMCRKTVIKRLVKYLPKSGAKDIERLNRVIDFDNQMFLATDNQRMHAENLLNNSTYDEDQRSFLMDKINDEQLTNGEIQQIITDLNNHQGEPSNPNGKDISRIVRQKVEAENT